MERFRYLRNVNPVIPQSGRAFRAFHLGRPDSLRTRIRVRLPPQAQPGQPLLL